ncbi:unnamed protein product, partial [marine sediment metagenome]
LPQAMVNFLALLGWSLDDRTELLSCQELIEHFSLERVSKTAAIFDKRKLEWMNGVYVRQLSSEEFVQLATPFLDRDLPPSIKRPLDNDYIYRIMPLLQERAKTLAEVSQLADFFFLDDLEYNAGLLLSDGLNADSATSAIEIALPRLEAVEPWDTGSLEAMLRPLAAELKLSTRKFFGLLRTATTGRIAAPPLFQTMAVLGKEKCLDRINAALQRLSAWR